MIKPLNILGFRTFQSRGEGVINNIDVGIWQNKDVSLPWLYFPRPTVCFCNMGSRVRRNLDSPSVFVEKILGRFFAL
jgi:hypothetical protein